MRLLLVIPQHSVWVGAQNIALVPFMVSAVVVPEGARKIVLSGLSFYNDFRADKICMHLNKGARFRTARPKIDMSLSKE
jgi:hypothetical protein